LQTVYSPDPDVKALQEILRYEGFFPANIEYTGNYGPITAKAVLEFQQKYNIGTPQEITSLKGKIVGPKTLAKLNELYN
jgi:peptidoglycan hydrolase-like protein with peptidoglycan-binding domain